MRILSHLLTVLHQIANWITGETPVSADTFGTRRIRRQSSTYHNANTQLSLKLLAKFFEGGFPGIYVVVLFASISTFSVGFSLSFYRLSWSPLCRFLGSPYCLVRNIVSPTMVPPSNGTGPGLTPYTSMANFTANLALLLIGLYIGSVLANTYGRRRTMAISAVTSILGWLFVVPYASTRLSPLFYIALLLNSFSCGMALLSTLLYFIEVVHKQNSVHVGCALFMSMLAGLTFGWKIHIQFSAQVIRVYHCYSPVPFDHSDAIEVIFENDVWTIFAIVGISISLFNMVLTQLIPDTPHWLVHVGDVDGATASLKELRPKFQESELEAIELNKMASSGGSSFAVHAMIRQCMTIQPGTFMYVVAIAMLQQLGGANFVPSYIESFHEHSYEHGEEGTVELALISCLSLLATIISCQFVSTRTLLMLSSAIMSASCLFYTVFLFLNFNELRFNIYAIYFIWLFCIGQSIGAAQVMPVIKYCAELPNPVLRSYGCFLVFSFAIITFYIVAVINIYIDDFAMFCIFAMANIGSLLCHAAS